MLIAPHWAMEMAALGSATGLNLADQFGSLAVGKQVNLVLYDLTNLSLLTQTDLLLMLGHSTGIVNNV